MNRWRFSWVFVALLLVAADVLAQKQGIKGQVFRSPDQSPVRPSSALAEPKFGLVCKVEIYKPTTSSDATAKGSSLYDDVQTGWVAEAQTKSDGSFKVKLEPGGYSVFVKLPEGLYSDQTDQEGRIGFVEVTKNTYSWDPIVVESPEP